MELSVKRKRVLITAGAGGIGRVMTETFVKAGAKVHICDVVQTALDRDYRGASGRDGDACATYPT